MKPIKESSPKTRRKFDPTSKAVALEVGLAARLRKEGHAVWQK